VTILFTYEHLNYTDIPRGHDYFPALTIHSLNSKGQSTRIAGIKTGRQHDLLSINEQNYFFIAEFSDFVIDIREQFPMNIDKTLLIASELGLKHPMKPKTNEPICMTSDFCITIRKEGKTYDVVRTIKPVQDLVQRRTIEKYEIERVYWEGERISWGIVTDVEINKTLAKNIRTFRGASTIDDIQELAELTYVELCSYKRELARRLISDEVTTRTVIRDFSEDYHLPETACITLFKHLVATKVLHMDLRTAFDMNKFNSFIFGHEQMEELLKAE
jgi:hypothetical protein